MPKASSFSRFTRGVRHTVRAFASTKHPVLVHIVPMRRCNLSCTYCNEYDKTSDPVAIDVMLERIDKLAEFGSSVITISGGEPMMHPQIFEIISRIRHHGMIAGLISNGYYFQPEKVKRLNEVGLDYLQISIDNVNPDEVSKKSLKVLDAKLINLRDYAKFKVNINSVVGGGVANPEEALIIANRAIELGFSSTVGVIHDSDGLNKGLTAREKEVYKEIKAKGTRSYARWNWFQDQLVDGGEYEWRCRAGARYLYVDEAALSVGVRSSAARPAFLFSNIRTKICGANTSRKNGARRPARFNAFTRSGISTPGATRRSLSRITTTARAVKA
jgi:MoaA/NifB/PqqE/SkfB family radical SAM enzyme